MELETTQNSETPAASYEKLRRRRLYVITEIVFLCIMTATAGIQCGIFNTFYGIYGHTTVSMLMGGLMERKNSTEAGFEANCSKAHHMRGASVSIRRIIYWLPFDVVVMLSLVCFKISLSVH